MKSLGAAAIRPTYTNALADGDSFLSDGKDADEEGFSDM